MSGKRVAYLGLAAGAGISITGNVTNTWMTDSAVSLGIRVPLAVIWPAAVFLAVEILVRINWRRRWLDYIGQAVLVGPAGLVAAINSYTHLHHLMTMAGEPGVAAVIGPLAIDGLMLGSTIALLAIRAATLAELEPEAAPGIEMPIVARVEELPVVEVFDETARTVQAERVKQQRSTPAALEAAVKMLLAGETIENAIDQTGLGASTLRRYVRVMAMVREGEPVDAAREKVRPAMLELITDELKRQDEQQEVGVAS